MFFDYFFHLYKLFYRLQFLIATLTIYTEFFTLPNSVLFFGILFIISFLFPLIEEYNTIFIGSAIVNNEYFSSFPKLPFVLPLLYGIILLYFQRAFELKNNQNIVGNGIVCAISFLVRF